MEKLVAPLIVLIVFGFLYFYGRSAGRGMGILLEMRINAMKQLLDRVTSGRELIELLSTEQGARILDVLKGPAPPPQPKPATPRGMVLGATSTGIVLVCLGIGFFVAALQLARVDWLAVAGTLLVSAGVGLLLATWIVWGLLQKWGRADGPAARGPTSPVS